MYSILFRFLPLNASLLMHSRPLHANSTPLCCTLLHTTPHYSTLLHFTPLHFMSCHVVLLNSTPCYSTKGRGKYFCFPYTGYNVFSVLYSYPQTVVRNYAAAITNRISSFSTNFVIVINNAYKYMNN